MSRPVWVIIAAAGQGVRAPGQVPKQFRRLGGSTLLETVVTRFCEITEVAGIVVALPREGIPAGAGLTADQIESLGVPDVHVRTVAGGDTRQESVMNALLAVPRDAEMVAVHDAARPFFSRRLFRRVLEACAEHGAAVPALTPSDTIKRLESGSPVVHATLDRRALVAAQTPQIFARDILVEAHRRARDEEFAATDDSELVERLGVSVAVVQGEPGNFKLTYPEDFDKAEAAFARLCRSHSGRAGLVGGSSPPTRVTVTGLGFDVHPFGEGRPCVIGGVTIPHERGLVGHSDADVLVHAVMDAVLGALSAGDIGKWFPDEPKYKGACSIELLRGLWKELRARAEVVHLDSVIIAEAPRIAPFASSMRANIASALEIAPDRVSIKATTSERMGFTGRGEGIAAFCTATLQREVT